jgi:hypothetical protein
LDVLTAVLACSLHPDPTLVRALVRTVSEEKPLFVGDFSSMTGNNGAASVQEAEVLVSEVLGKDHLVVVGLMGVPREWAQIYNREPGTLWDSCTNIGIGTAKLSEFAAECRSTEARGRRRSRTSHFDVTSSRARTCLLRKYAQALGLPANWPGLVLAEAFGLNSRSKVPAPGVAGKALDQDSAMAKDWNRDLFFGGDDEAGAKEPAALPSLPPRR